MEFNEWFPYVMIVSVALAFGLAGYGAYHEVNLYAVETAKCEAMPDECSELWCMAKFYQGDTGLFYLKMYELKGCAE